MSPHVNCPFRRATGITDPTAGEQIGVQPMAASRIFLTPRGCDWTRDTSNFRRWLHAILYAAGVPYRDATGRVLHVHCLRKTSVTRCARAGVPIQKTQMLHGIKTVQIVHAIYTDLDTEALRSAVASLPRIPQSDSAE